MSPCPDCCHLHFRAPVDWPCHCSCHSPHAYATRIGEQSPDPEEIRHAAEVDVLRARLTECRREVERRDELLAGMSPKASAEQVASEVEARLRELLDNVGRLKAEALGLEGELADARYALGELAAGRPVDSTPR